MTKKHNHHVVTHNGAWAVRREGADRASGTYSTQQEAINAGRKISRNQQTELYIHRTDGTIRQRDSHGSDPSPPKG